LSPIILPAKTGIGLILLTFLCFCVVLANLKIVFPRFSRFLHGAPGPTPDSSETSTLGMVFGILGYFLACLPAFASIVLLISAFTISPTVLSAEGINGGGSIFRPPTTIRWEEVDRVDCTTAPQGYIMDLTVRAGSRGVVIADTVTLDLSLVRSAIQSQVPPGTIHPCKAFHSRSSALSNH
jgi:hypothetical protein